MLQPGSFTTRRYWEYPHNDDRTTNRAIRRPVAHPLGQAHLGQQPRCLGLPLAARDTGKDHGERHVLQRRHGGDKVEGLENEAHPLAAVSGQGVLVQGADIFPLTTIRPWVGRSRPPIRLSSVDLPESDGPAMQRNSAGATTRLTACRARMTCGPTTNSLDSSTVQTIGFMINPQPFWPRVVVVLWPGPGGGPRGRKKRLMKTGTRLRMRVRIQ